MTKAWLKCDRINLDYFKAKLVNIPKITILQGNEYHPEQPTAALPKVYPQILH